MRPLLRHLPLVAMCLLLTPSLASAEAASPDQGEVAIAPQPSTLPASWIKGPFIEIYVRGFRDSNGDGKGDLRGVIEKLDYLKDMGFTGIWLMPVFKSEDDNHGYAVTNYRKVETAYGNNDDLRQLIQQAHQRGIGLMLDYIPNQAASRHPLFEASVDKNSPYRDWFNWANEQPDGWSGFNGAPWVERDGSWFYAVYDPIMPDWNWRNPAVMDFHLNNLKFWLNQGVDGFRMDAVGPLVENGPLAWQNQPESMDVTHRFGQLLKQYPGTTWQVCEAPGDVAGFAAENACGSAFAFGLQTAIIKSVRLGRVDRELPDYLASKPMARLATFLSNHDTFAGVRLFNQLEGDLQDYRLAAATQYLLPGTPFTLYGEEVGLSMASGAGGSDEQIRTLMSWTGDETLTNAEGKTVSTFGGFTALPAGRERRLFRAPADNWKTNNVASQQQDPHSLLNFYRQLIALRRGNASLMDGSYQRVDARLAGKKQLPQETVLSFIRELNGEQVLVAINYANKPAALSLALPGKSLEALWPVSGAQTRLKAGRLLLDLPAKRFAVYRLHAAHPH